MEEFRSRKIKLQQRAKRQHCPAAALLTVLSSAALAFPTALRKPYHLLRAPGPPPPRRSAMSRQPEVLWAQRSEKVYLTISVPDSEDVVVKTEPQGILSFSAVAHGESFSFTLELFDSILPEGSKTKTKVGSRNIICSIEKDKKCWWKRLLKSEEKHPYIKVDWNKWHDEDEESAHDTFYGGQSNKEFLTEASAGSDNDFDDGENEDSDGDDGLLYLPDLEKLRGK